MPYIVMTVDGTDLDVTYYEDRAGLEKLLDDYAAASEAGVPEPRFLDKVPIAPGGYRLITGEGMDERDVVIFEVARALVTPFPVTRRWAIG